ncbi:hypothetical protein, partial [Pseudomonas viridiflava]|uniref:hypothetical protein n=1 Tax=Pseudomonas viridiflava TaxID=33069 RepID=UPI0019D2C70C
RSDEAIKQGVTYRGRRTPVAPGMQNSNASLWRTHMALATRVRKRSMSRSQNAGGAERLAGTPEMGVFIDITYLVFVGLLPVTFRHD